MPRKKGTEGCEVYVMYENNPGWYIKQQSESFLVAVRIINIILTKNVMHSQTFKNQKKKEKLNIGKIKTLYG